MLCLTPGPALVIHPHGAGDAAATLGADAGARPAVDDELLRFRVPPDRCLERIKLIPAQMLGRPFPYAGGFGDVGIAVKGRKILGHRFKRLNWHTTIPP